MRREHRRHSLQSRERDHQRGRVRPLSWQRLEGRDRSGGRETEMGVGLRQVLG